MEVEFKRRTKVKIKRSLWELLPQTFTRPAKRIPCAPCPWSSYGHLGCFPNPRLGQTKTQIRSSSPLLNCPWCWRPQTRPRWCDFGRSRTGLFLRSAWKLCRRAMRPGLLPETHVTSTILPFLNCRELGLLVLWCWFSLGTDGLERTIPAGLVVVHGLWGQRCS